MRNTQKKGDYAVTRAIATFTRLNYDVSIPLTESASYDLVIEKNGILKRIQVRYTSTQDVDLRRIHSNSNDYVVKKTKINAYNWLYIFQSDGKEFLIKQCLYERRSIKPNNDNLLK